MTKLEQAARQAVKLGINVVIYGATAAQANQINIGVNEGVCDGCIYKATRRAIVRAAAEIGKELP